MLTTRVNGVQISWTDSLVADMVDDILNAIPVPLFKPYGRVQTIYGSTTAAHGDWPASAYGIAPAKYIEIHQDDDLIYCSD